MSIPLLPHPALAALSGEIQPELLFGEIIIRRTAVGFTLCHQNDASRLSDALRSVPLDGLRELANFTVDRAFRPLKTAPTLPAGWISAVTNDADLEQALERIYPGALADWWAARNPQPPTTDFVTFARRQTGRYQVVQTLSPTETSLAIRACCHPDSCLRRRLWNAEGLLADSESEKSIIPCLEPCAIFLDVARTMARKERDGNVAGGLKSNEGLSKSSR